jgi:phosphoribulokinase
MRTFEQIFRRERVAAAFIEGDSFHRYDRATMKQKMAEALARGEYRFSHFGPDSNRSRSSKICQQLRPDRTRQAPQVLHDEQEAARYGAEPGTFTEWEQLPEETDVLFYEGCTAPSRAAPSTLRATSICSSASCRSSTSSGSRSCIGQVDARLLRRSGDRHVPAAHARLRALHLSAILTHAHQFQRVPVVDTSDPFIARFIPTQDESFLVIRFGKPQGHRLSLSAVDAAWVFMSARQHDRVPRRQDGPRDAADSHADDPAPHRAQKGSARAPALFGPSNPLAPSLQLATAE